MQKAIGALVELLGGHRVSGVGLGNDDASQALQARIYLPVAQEKARDAIVQLQRASEQRRVALRPAIGHL
jgi:hypothetical protein